MFSVCKRTKPAIVAKRRKDEISEESSENLGFEEELLEEDSDQNDSEQVV